MKTPNFTPNYSLPELKLEDGLQVVELDLIDEANDLSIIATAYINVATLTSGDGCNTPKITNSKALIESIDFEAFDANGNRVIDEGGVIYKELEKIIKGKYD
jgi:hypothetical protein